MMNLYIHINLILIGTFLFFTFTRWILKCVKVRVSPQMLVRLSQALIVISILSPVCLSLVPEKRLPALDIRLMNRISENVDFSARFHKEVTSKSITRESTENPQESGSKPNLELLPMLCLFGFLICSLLTLRSFLKLNRLLDLATPFRQINEVKIAASENVSVPFSARFYKTKWVIVPVSLLTQKQDLALALKHELQHHRQSDTLWAVWIELFKCIFYLNPFSYLWKNLVIELQEFSCDEALLGQRGISARDYGSCLVRVAEAALENREMHIGTTCMATVSRNPMVFKSFLKRRIEMIMQDQKSTSKLAGIFIGTLTLLFTVAIAYGMEQTSRNAINPGQAQVNEAIQKIADQVLAKAIKDEGAQGGIAIVADPNTGKILAIANIDTKNQRKGHWGLSESNEPASFLKAIVAAEALEQGATTPTSSLNCEKGKYQFGNQTYHDWRDTGFDQLTTTEAIAISSDICAMKIAEKLGPEKLHAMLTRFGFGAGGTATEFPEAKVGTLPALDLGKDSKLIPEAAYGMGFNTTPIEIIQAFGAIANGGNLLRPKLANSRDETPEVIRRVLSEENAKKARLILEQVVLSGTAKKESVKGLYTMAGKTESTYTGGVIEGDSTGGQFHTNLAGFVGFAPVMNPKVEIFVQIFSPKDPTGAHGSTHAAPVFTTLANEVLKQMKVTPDKQKI